MPTLSHPPRPGPASRLPPAALSRQALGGAGGSDPGRPVQGPALRPHTTAKQAHWYKNIRIKRGWGCRPPKGKLIKNKGPGRAEGALLLISRQGPHPVPTAPHLPSQPAAPRPLSTAADGLDPRHTGQSWSKSLSGLAPQTGLLRGKLSHGGEAETRGETAGGRRRPAW